jgi:hypothetical protein
MRLDTGLITSGAYHGLGPKKVAWLLDWVPGVYRTGYHHYYLLRKKKPSCALWWPLPARDSHSDLPPPEPAGGETTSLDVWNVSRATAAAVPPLSNKPKACRRCDRVPGD